MPNIAQLRAERIDKLFAEFKGKNIVIIDPIYRRARELFPDVMPETARSYAEAVLRRLKTSHV